ncbi:MAG: hypothetical protein JEZ12_28220 [Desulfobacterium sp.]|nr:hypothetical protein [Desulfobacterium sp.]
MGYLMIIEQAKAMGLCKKACNFAEKGECAYHRFPSHNYLCVKPGVCALNEEDVDIMVREYNLRRIRR